MQIVNGYICMNCCDVDKARLGQDPHQQANQIQKQLKDLFDSPASAKAGPAVTFGGSPATINANTPTQVYVTTPAGTGTVDVVLTTPGGSGTIVRSRFAVASSRTAGASNRSSGPASIPSGTIPSNCRVRIWRLRRRSWIASRLAGSTTS